MLPALALQLSFAFIFIGAQFFMMFYLLSRPRKYTVTPEDVQIGVGFDSYRGQPDLLDHARSTVAILRGVKEFEARGGEMPKGLLLSGGPGTGKTFLASCIAAEAQLPFVYLDASSLQGAFVGTSQLMVGKLFRDARGLARRYAEPGKRGACIVFLDELDAIGQSRGGQGGGMGIGLGGGMMGGMGGGAQGLNALLNQMDSLTEHIEDRWRFKVLRWFGLIRGPVKNRPLVFVIGATNRPEVLDAALVRPGRLDRIIEVHPPDADGRRDIINFYLSKKAHSPDLDLEMMITDSMEWTPILIKTVINEALIHAHNDGREQITYKDWLAAADERSDGIKQPIRSWHRDDRRKTAYHEAAHAVVARYVLTDSRISKATIIRRGHALGMVVPKPKEERTSLLPALDRVVDHGRPGRARDRDALPEGPLDRPVVGPARGDDAGDLLRLAVGDGPDEGRRATHRGPAPAGALPRRGERAPRPALCRDGAGHPPEDDRGPLRGAGADRARRADRRRARGGLQGGRGGRSDADPAVRAEAAPVPGVHAAPAGPRGAGEWQPATPPRRPRSRRRRWGRSPRPRAPRT